LRKNIEFLASVFLIWPKELDSYLHPIGLPK